MHFAQLLVGERGAKVRVAAAEELKDFGFHVTRQLMMAALSPFLREQRFGAAAFEGVEQALDLPDAEPELLGRLPLLDLFGFELFKNLDATELSLAQW